MASNLIVTWSEMFRTNSFAPIDIAFLHTIDTSQNIISECQNVPGLLEIVSKRVDSTKLKEALDRKNYYFSRFERKMSLEKYFTT